MAGEMDLGIECLPECSEAWRDGSAARNAAEASGWIPGAYVTVHNHL